MCIASLYGSRNIILNVKSYLVASQKCIYGRCRLSKQVGEIRRFSALFNTVTHEPPIHGLDEQDSFTLI